MKKLIALLLALAMILSLAACGAPAEDTPAPDTDKPAADAPAADKPAEDKPASTEPIIIGVFLL